MQELEFGERWRTYLRERFPLGAHGPTIVVFTVSCAVLAQASGTGPIVLGGRVVAACVALLLVFFHFRVFDECKDAAEDATLRPERPIARGVITLNEVERAGTLAIIGEFVLALGLGRQALAAWGLVFAFSILMRKEFFVGPWLRPHLFSYAVPHTLSASFIALFVYSAVTERFPWEVDRFFALFALSCWGLFTVFEVARKAHAPDEERPGVPTYSQQWGPAGAAAATCGLILLTAAPVIWGAVALGLARAFAIGLGLAAAAVAVAGIVYGMRPTRKTAKLHEALGSLYLLLHGAIPAAILAWTRGVAGAS